MVQRQVSVTEPWAPVGDRLAGPGGVFETAEQLYGQIPDYFPYQTTVGFSPQQELAMGLTQQRALQGSPAERALGGYLTGSLGQDRIDLAPAVGGAQGLIGGLGAGQQSLMGLAGGGANPYLDAQFDAASRGLGRQFQQNVLPGIAAQFGAGGRTGSGAHQQALGTAQQQFGTAIGDLGANIYGRAYETDANRRLQAAQALQAGGLGGVGALGDLYGGVSQDMARAGALTPMSTALDYQNIDRLMGVGQQVRGLGQEQLQAERDRYNYYQGAPYQQLGAYADLLRGSPQGGRQTTTGNLGGPSRGQAALGGALAGAGIGSSFSPFGALLGGGLGALGGLLFGG